jgi:hypothetical protein
MIAIMALALACLPGGLVHAQSDSGRVDQVSGLPDAAMGMGQINVDARSVEVDGLTVPRDAAPAPQLSQSSDSPGNTRQLTREGGAGPAPDQLYRGGRTAQPAEPLSRPGEGRTSAVTPVGGQDRCDPAAAGRGEATGCERVIETRASEFQRIEPVLSAEQRLLTEQRLREQSASAGEAARRLAAPGGDPDSLEEQGIASLVLSNPQPMRPDEEQPSEAATSLIEAIVGGMTGTPPQ